MSVRRIQESPSGLEVAFLNAIKDGKQEVVRSLLGDRSILYLEELGTSALMMAIEGGHENIVRLLINREANPNPKEFLSNMMPLYQAIRFFKINLAASINIAAVLLEFGAILEACDEFGRTALFKTLNTHDIRGAEFLHQQGACIASRDHGQNTILHQAATSGRFGHALLFIDQGVEVNLPNKIYQTPLALATQNLIF